MTDESKIKLIKAITSTNNGVQINIDCEDVCFKKEMQQEPATQQKTAEEAKENLAKIISGWESGRMMYCVLRGIMLAGKAATLVDADKKLKVAFNNNVPGKPYDVATLEYKLNVLSLKDSCDDWVLEDSPFKDPNTFEEYRYNTRIITDIIKNSDLFD